MIFTFYFSKNNFCCLFYWRGCRLGRQTFWVEFVLPRFRRLPFIYSFLFWTGLKATIQSLVRTHDAMKKKVIYSSFC